MNATNNTSNNLANLMYNHGAKKRGSDSFYTPQWIKKDLDQILGKGYLDPCPGHQQPHLRPPGVILGVGDGLGTDWTKYSHSFVNPPFSDMKKWLDKVSLSADQGHRSLWFVKLDYRVSWYDTMESTADWIIPIKGYVRFEDKEGVPYSAATFQMCFAGWGIDKGLVRNCYNDRLVKIYESNG
jgi:hypothetical protein